MNDKQKLLALLRDELNHWQETLDGMSETQLTTPPSSSLPGSDPTIEPSVKLSVKDLLGHLRAWQQVSIARLEAALLDTEPDYPAWVGGQHPDAEEYLDQYNAAIHAAYRDQPWSSVHGAWRAGFQRFLELTEAIPEDVLFAPNRFTWLDGYPLSAVLEGSYEHHEEHLADLRG